MSNNSNKMRRVDVVIIGAGPATLGLICNAAKTNRLHELVTTGDGIAILEQGLTFGGGGLQHFGINSNTSANGFLKCTYKKKDIQNTQSSVSNDSPARNQRQGKALGEIKSNTKDKGDDESDEDDDDSDELAEDSEHGDDEVIVSPQPSFEWTPLNCFKDLYKCSPIYNLMAEFGGNIAPLSVVGMFLNYTGNHLLHYIHTVMKRKVFYPSHRVTGIQLLQNGEVLVSAVRKQCMVTKNDKNGHIVFSEQEQQVSFRSKAVVISNGGRQVLHPSFYKEWFPFMKERQDRVILGAHFLAKDVFKQTMDTINTNKYKNIVIVGGSHSGFSCAWLMLNGPATYNRNNSIDSNKHKFMPEAKMKTIEGCQECCTCTEAKKKKEPKCGCLCKCYGFFNFKEWDYDPEKDAPKHFEAGSIKILYRDKIRVFYGTVNQAKADNYQMFNENLFTNKNGFVYSYTGLRGDAKKLFRSMNQGKENRVKLVKAQTIEEQAEIIKDADLVIWAAGYQTNKIVIKDHEGKEIPLSQRVANTQFDVDGKCRICVADGSFLTKCFGMGIAYPTLTNDGMMRPDGGKVNPRADSFSLYCNWVANRVLMNILPKSLLDNKLHRTLRNNRKKAIENNKTNNNNNKSETNSPVKTTKKQDIKPKSSNKNIPNTVKKELNSKTEGLMHYPKPDISKTLSPMKPKNVQRAESSANPVSSSPEPPSTDDAQVFGNLKEIAATYGQNYLKGTVLSNNRAQASQDTGNIPAGAGEKDVEGPVIPAYIPPVITKSQEAYIAKRKQIQQENQEKEQTAKTRGLPPVGQLKNSTQSRYMQQTANSVVKKVENEKSHYPVPSQELRSPIKRGGSSSIKKTQTQKKKDLTQSPIKKDNLIKKRASIPIVSTSKDMEGEHQEMQMTTKSELRTQIDDKNQIKGDQFYNKEVDNPLSSDELDNAIEINRNQHGQEQTKRDISDEMSTKSSKRRSNDPNSNDPNSNLSPENKIVSKDFVFSSPDSQVKTQTKLSKLFDQSSSIARKKSGFSRQTADQMNNLVYNQGQMRPQSNSNHQSIDQNRHSQVNNYQGFSPINDVGHLQKQYQSNLNALTSPDRVISLKSSNLTSSQQLFISQNNFGQYINQAQNNYQQQMVQSPQLYQGQPLTVNHRPSKSNWNTVKLTQTQDAISMQNTYENFNNNIFLQKNGAQIALKQAQMTPNVKSKINPSSQNQQVRTMNSSIGPSHQLMQQPQPLRVLQQQKPVPVKVFKIPGLVPGNVSTTAKPVLVNGGIENLNMGLQGQGFSKFNMGMQMTNFGSAGNSHMYINYGQQQVQQNLLQQSASNINQQGRILIQHQKQSQNTTSNAQIMSQNQVISPLQVKGPKPKSLQSMQNQISQQIQMHSHQQSSSYQPNNVFQFSPNKILTKQASSHKKQFSQQHKQNLKSSYSQVPSNAIESSKPESQTIMMNVDLNTPKKILHPQSVQLAGQINK